MDSFSGNKPVTVEPETLQAEQSVDVEKLGEKLAPYNPSDPKVVEIAIQLLELKNGDVVYDLGCGDGRFLIAACSLQSDIIAVGIEYDKVYYGRACAAIEQSGLQRQIRVVHGNILELPFDDATAIFMYLVPTGIRKIREKLIELLQRGIRIVTYVFSIPGLQPVHEELFKGSTKIYKYSIESINCINDIA